MRIRQKLAISQFSKMIKWWFYCGLLIFVAQIAHAQYEVDDLLYPEVCISTSLPSFAAVRMRDSGQVDIYWHQPDGGVWLTDNTGRETILGWSGDGRYLAVMVSEQDNRSLIFVDTDTHEVIGVETNIPFIDNWQWSPNGTKFMYVLQTSPSRTLRMYNATTQSLDTFNLHEGTYDIEALWSPDGKYFVFSERWQDANGYGTALVFQEGDTEILKESLDTALPYLFFSYDSAYLVVSRDDIRIYNMASTTLVASFDGSLPLENWAPQSHELVFYRDGKSYLYDVDTGEETYPFSQLELIPTPAFIGWHSNGESWFLTEIGLNWTAPTTMQIAHITQENPQPQDMLEYILITPDVRLFRSPDKQSIYFRIIGPHFIGGYLMSLERNEIIRLWEHRNGANFSADSRYFSNTLHAFEVGGEFNFVQIIDMQNFAACSLSEDYQDMAWQP